MSSLHRHIRPWFAGAVVAAGTWASGCAVGPDYEPPTIPVPEQFSGRTDSSMDAAASRAWWAAFKDPELNAIVDRMLTQNLDLAAAIERVESARALYGIARADFAPQADASAGYARGRSFFLPMGDQWTVGGSMAWEIDLFGRIRRSVEAAVASFEAQVEDLRGARVALLAETTANYLQLVSLDERLAIAKRNVEGQEQSKKIADQRFGAGVAAGLDPAQAEVNLARTQARVPVLELARRRALHRLAVLTGQDPTALVDQLQTTAELPTFPPEFAVGIPADLLRNRPDIRALERRLAAQTARVGVAVAAHYPSIQISGSWQWLAVDLDQFFHKTLESGSIGPRISLPLFTGGRLTARVDAEEAALRQAHLALRQGVLVAQEEVENALMAIMRDRRQVQLLATAADAARRTVGLARDLYTSGQSDFQNVLDAERSLFAIEDELAVARLSVLLDLVDLHRALGAGWAAATDPEAL